MSVGPEGIVTGCAPWGCERALFVKVYAAIGEPRYISEDPEPVVFMLPGTSIDVDRYPLGGATYIQGDVDSPAGLVQHYSYSGGDLTVSVQEISPPFTVTAGDTTFAPGASVRFTAGGDLNGSSFRDYYFVPGDTAAEPAWNGLLSGTYRVRACSGAPGFSVCPYAPKEAGRMYLGATYRGSWGFAASKVVRPAQARITLTCVGPPGPNPVNTITRGDTITCTAGKPANTPGELKITGWSFGDKPRKDGDATSATWEGIMVRGGTVRVEGKVGDKLLEPATATITVLDRDWSEKRLSFRTEEDNGDHIEVRERPTRSEDLGLFLPVREAAGDLMETIRVVNAGPNTKLAYLRAPPFSIVGYYRVNRIALAEQSVFWQRQAVRQHTTIFGMVMCGRADVVPFIPVVLSHEGANLEPKSHAFFFNEELQRHNAQEIEDLTSDMGSAEVEDGARNEIIDQAERWTTGILEKAAEKDDQADNKRNAPQYCTFSYFSRN